jgi:pyruvate dehydrogenase E1 component
MPEGVEAGIVKGMYRLKAAEEKGKLRVNLMGGGAILREVEAAAEILQADYEVASDVWSLTSVNELQREGKSIQRWNMLNPESEPKQAYVSQQLGAEKVPTIAATDYMKSYSDQLREFVPGSFTSLGTDGYGRSDSRKKLREFFEVSREFIVIAALKALADEGSLEPSVVSAAMVTFGIDADKIDPVTV